MKTNRIMLADSYKYAQTNLYPENTTYMFDYMEARSSKVFPETVFFGLQFYIKKYLAEPIEMWEVEEAAYFAKQHGEPFNYDGWKYIVEKCNGFIPVRIRAVKEGTIVPNGNVLMTIESTDPKVFWVVSFLETLLMKIWYPTTVATKSYFVKKIIMKYLESSGSPESIDFKYHNFGDRGASSVESAAIGGMAHLTQFKGTDNFNALKYAKEYYNAENIGFSIPATEHSNVTSWGKEKRFNFYENYIEEFKSCPIIACVMDSYDIYEDVKFVTSGSFKEKIESNEYPTFVIRPDSGQPVEVMNSLLNIMEDNSVDFYINEKGFKVFKKYAFIWGDGISPEVIEEILEYINDRNYSADIIAFGSGGDLMQKVNRDTLGFAIKCSSITVNSKDVDVFKEPITDMSKKSKKGIIELYKENGKFVTMKRDADKELSCFVTYYNSGKIYEQNVPKWSD